MTVITAEMNIVLNTLHNICDEDGFFNFEDLRQTGLSRVEVQGTIADLKHAGYSIFQVKTTCFGGGSFRSWQWNDVAWAAKYAEYEASQQKEVNDLAREQAAAVAAVERMLEK